MCVWGVHLGDWPVWLSPCFTNPPHTCKLQGRGQPGGFRLEPGETAPQTQWMKACGWGAAQDACLLVGVHRHGIGHWDRCVSMESGGLAWQTTCGRTPGE